MADAVSVLSDATIRRLVEEGRITIDPWDPGMVQPASVDLRLGSSFRVFHNHHITSIDLKEPPPALTEEVDIGEDGTFVIHPGEFCLGATREWVELPHDIVARIEGKALALDTEVPTPRGWTTMGELRAGDHVLDASGRPTRVVAATEPMQDRPCRKVVFSDGTSVIADLDHRWEVRTQDDRGGGRTRLLTTRAIERTVRLPDGEYAFHVEEGVPPRPGEGAGAPAEAEPALAGVTARQAPRLLASRVRAAPRTRTPRGLARRFRRGRAIVDVRRTPSVPVRCIEVASPRGTFLVTRSFVPTHNSSLGRLGLIVHATAGFCDPGWRGSLTLELNNLMRVPIELSPGLPIAQLSFMTLDRPAERPYGHEALGSHYQGQAGATQSRYGEDPGRCGEDRRP